MRCLRLVSMFVPVVALLCGLVGAAEASYLRVTNPVPPAARAFGNVQLGGNANQTVTIRSCQGNDPLVCVDNNGSSTDLGSFTLPSPSCDEFTVVPPSPALPITIVGTAALAQTFTFRYTPTNRGDDTCVVTAVVTSGGDTGTTFTLTGTGVASSLTQPATPLAFASQNFNSATGTQTQNITLVNSGNQAIQMTDLTVTLSATTEFSMNTGAIVFPIAAGGMATLPVTFNPTSIGAKTATVTFAVGNDNGEPNRVVTLNGTGTQSIATVPASVVFAAHAVGTPGTENLVVMNTGTGPLTISSLVIAAPNAADFAFTDHACTGQSCAPGGGVVIMPGMMDTFVLDCTPQAAGLRAAVLTITSDDAVAATDRVALKCTGNNVTLPSDKVGPPPSAAQNVTVANAGTTPLTYSVASQRPAEFILACGAGGMGADGCTDRVVAPGTSQTITVAFQATITGGRTSNLSFTSDDPDTSGEFVVASSTGTAPAVSLIAPAVPPLNFGNVPVPGPSAAQTITLRNTGTANLDVTSVVLTGGDAAQFAIASGAVNAHPLAPVTNESWTVTCSPTTAGAKTTTFRITHDAPAAGSTTDVTLNCNGTVPDIITMPAHMGTLAFSGQKVGTLSATQAVMVSNAVGPDVAPLTFMATVIGANANQFTLACPMATCVCVAGTCTGTRNAGESTQLNVLFGPTSAGAKVANVQIMANDPDEAVTTINLTGTGTVPMVTVTLPAAPPLNLGDVDVVPMTTSMPGTVQITNSGDADLAISAVTLVGGNAAEFAIATGGTGAQTLVSTAGMNTRSWTVTCTPTAIGARTTTFRITHDAPVAGTQTNVNLTCNGTAARFLPSIVPPAKLDFGQVQQNTASMPRTFTFTNNGNKAGRIAALMSTNGAFAATTTADLMQNIAVNGSITVSVVFTPPDSAVQNGQICAMHNGLNGNTQAITPVCVDVTGDGQSVGLEVTATPAPPIAFGTVTFNAAPIDSRVLTIRNTGESDLRITSVSSAGAPFAITGLSQTVPFTLAMNATATFRIRLTPSTDLGMKMQNVTVSGTFLVSGAIATDIVSATAQIVAPQVTMTSDTITFDPFDVDDPGTAVEKTVMITNTGNATTGAPLSLGVKTLPAGGPDFAIVNPAAVVVMPGMSAPVTVRFDPSTAGARTGSVTIPLGVALNGTMTVMSYTVALSGLAIDQNVACSPMTIQFPETVRQQAADPKTASVTNLDFAVGPGTAAPVTYTAAISGGNASDFTLGAGEEAGAIAGNASKTLTVTFKPTAAGAMRTANLVVSYTDMGTKTCTVALRGDGRLRIVRAAPSESIDFGKVAAGTTVRLSEVASMVQLMSMEPAGATATRIAKLEPTGAGASAFTVVDGATPRTLASGAMEAYDVEFSPDAEGVYLAEVNVFFDDDPEKQYTFMVRGEAVDLTLRGGGCDSGGGGAGVLVGLVALGLALGRRRAVLTALGALALLVGPAAAHAQDRGKLDSTTFAPVASTEPGMFTVLSPAIARGGAWSLDLAFQHDTDPLTASSAMGDDVPLIERRDSLSLGFAYALSRKLELGATLPMHSQAGCGDRATCKMASGVFGPESPGSFTLGDVAVRAKASLATGTVGFGAMLTVTAPTASDGSFAGSSGPTAHLQALMGLAIGKRIGLAINGGFRARKSSEVLQTAQGSEATFGAAASFRAFEKVWVIGEGYGTVGVIGAEGNVSPMSFLFGVRYRATHSLLVGFGGGGGMGQAVGIPALRGFASISLVPGAKADKPLRLPPPPPPPPDTGDDDGDGIINDKDECKGLAEDKDGYTDDDGCPELDNDGDGMPDTTDRCVNEPEDKDGFEDADGCSDPDNDGDGVGDLSDRCPNEPEDMDGYNDTDGCDEPDNDKDGILDVLDQCALEPETINGNNDDDGCPDAGDSLVMVMQDRIEALEPITFVGVTAKLGKGASGMIGQVGATLRADASIKKIRVTVHVHPRGAGDQALSDKRAEEIRKALLATGVEPERLDARGIGSERPLVARTAKGAEQINDRVEFIILERK